MQQHAAEALRQKEKRFSKEKEGFPWRKKPAQRICDVSRVAYVSKSTVSHVINGAKQVSVKIEFVEMK